MPIVTAAGYPTLVAPSTEAAPTPGADYQNISGADPNAFGAGVGRAQQQLGDTFEKASNQFEQVALQQQQLTNQVAASNADNFTMDEVQKILHGDPNKPGDVGYFGLKGNDAVNARQSTMKAIDDLVNQTRGTLTNPRQQVMFDQQTRRMRNYWIGSVGQHYDQQLNVATAASLTASRQLAEHQQASAAANIDEVGFGLGVQKEMEAANQQAQHLGFDQTWLDNEYDKIRAKATKQWVDSVGVKNPLAADEFLEHNKDALLPGEYRQLKGELHSRAIQQKAQEANYGVPSGQAPSDPSKIQGGMVRGGAISGRISDPRGMVPYIRETAQKYGIDPDVAVAVARSEGLATFLGDSGKSGGAFQLYTGGGVGNEFQRDTGLNPLDPTNEKETIDYALKTAAQRGWGDWHGAARIGITGRQGIGGAHDTTVGDISKYRAEYDAYKPEVARRTATTPRYEPPMYGKESFEDWMGRIHPEVALTPKSADTATTTTPQVPATKTAVGGDQVIRPLPPLEPNELPDAQVPGLPERIQQLAKKLPPPDSYENREVWNAAVKIARKDMNEAYANQQHQLRMKQQEDKANDEALTMDYYRKLGQPNGPTTQQVLNDTRFRTPEAVKNVVGFIERENKHDPAADVSKRTTHELFQRMTAPDEDSIKLRDMQTVHEAYNAGTLTRQDHDWLIGQGTKLEKEADESFKEFKNRHVRATMGKILGNSAFLPDNLKDPEDLARFQQYTDAVDAKVEAYKKQNKNPRDLWNPKNTDSVVSPEFLKEHGPSVVDAIKAAPGSVDLSTPEKVGEALRANRISYDAAVKRLETLGLKHKEVTGQPAAVQ